MSLSGVTRTCTIAPIIEALDRAGGSVARVFRQADVSPRLIDDPARLILLKDQFALLDATAREIGDTAVATRLSLAAGIDGLGAYGHCVASQPTLRDALRLARGMLPHALQTATRVGLTTHGAWSTWTYEVDDSAVVGRRQNDLLYTGYVLDVFRRFGGERWMPHRMAIAGPAIEAREKVETALGCTMEPGALTALTFPTDLLDAPNVAPLVPKPFRSLPAGNDTATLVTQAIGSGLGTRRPNLERTARRLGLTPRTLQRRLRERGSTFEALLDEVLADHAMAMMEGPVSLTAIAYDLGYADLAHFSRAFKRWTGRSPDTWRRAHRSQAAISPS